MSNTGHAAACSSSTAKLSMTSRSVITGKVAVATALPATSCAQVTAAPGVTVISLDSMRRSRLSRGRSIRRCGPRLTGT